jgi:hypothetical protein
MIRYDRQFFVASAFRVLLLNFFICRIEMELRNFLALTLTKTVALMHFINSIILLPKIVTSTTQENVNRVRSTQQSCLGHEINLIN